MFEPPVPVVQQRDRRMNRDDVLGMTSMPFASPSYPRGLHPKADLTLPYGHVLHDYLE